VSSRGREPEWDDEDEWDEPDPRRGGGRGRRPPPRPARTYGLPIVAAALLTGLIVGFIASCGGGGTTTVTETLTVTAPESAAAPGAVTPSGPASRATIALAVLNGSGGETGLAAARADDARALGYASVVEGNAPTPVTSDLIVYRKGAAARAAQVAEDLGLDTPTLATAGDPILDAAPDAVVFVVLGPTGASTPGTGTGTTG
jgi:hypothetical protein